MLTAARTPRLSLPQHRPRLASPIFTSGGPVRPAPGYAGDMREDMAWSGKLESGAGTKPESFYPSCSV